MTRLLGQRLEAGARVIRDEYEAFGIDNTPNFSERGLVEGVKQQDDRYTADILRVLLWRGQQQRMVFCAFLELCKGGFCDISALRKPVDYSFFAYYGKKTKTALWIDEILVSFPQTRPLWETGSVVMPLENRNLQWRTFHYPLVWLTAMLIRSSVDIHETLTALILRGLLGSFDKEHFEGVRQLKKVWSPNPEGLVERRPQVSPAFGFFLPSGVDIPDGKDNIDEIVETFFTHLDRLEMAFEEYFLMP